MKVSVTQLDIENAQAHGLTRKNAQYERIKGKNNIDCIIILDEYINYISAMDIVHDLSDWDTEDYKRVSKVLSRYPFERPDLISIDTDTLLAALDEERYAAFCAQFDKPWTFSLAAVLSQKSRSYNNLLELKERTPEIPNNLSKKVF